jgi:hypothetical protein
MNRDEARQKAERYLADLRGRGQLSDATGIGRVLRWDEPGVRLPTIYGRSPFARCWIGYLEMPVRGLVSSTILIIDDATGDLLYTGSAYDEG